MADRAAHHSEFQSREARRIDRTARVRFHTRIDLLSQASLRGLDQAKNGLRALQHVVAEHEYSQRLTVGIGSSFIRQTRREMKVTKRLAILHHFPVRSARIICV